MADASDSKSDEGDFVRVQVPPSAFLGRGALYNEYEDRKTGAAKAAPVFFSSPAMGGL